jgi:ribonuclease HII
VLIGIDEAGRGCLAGPVMAGAVYLPTPIPALNDSKKLSAAQRQRLWQHIQAQAHWGLGVASAEEIDQINILQASLLAMQRALQALSQKIAVSSDAMAWVDGNRAPTLPIATRTLIGGDALMPEIMAASIVAKVLRDQYLDTLDRQYSAYGFAQHKGYGTAQHVAALQKHGPCPAHRQSFAPVRQFALF